MIGADSLVTSDTGVQSDLGALDATSGRLKQPQTITAYPIRTTGTRTPDAV